MNRREGQSGLSVLEMMVVVVTLTIVLLAAFPVLDVTSSAADSGIRVAAERERGRQALEKITADIREADTDTFLLLEENETDALEYRIPAKPEGPLVPSFPGVDAVHDPLAESTNGFGAGAPIDSDEYAMQGGYYDGDMASPAFAGTTGADPGAPADTEWSGPIVIRFEPDGSIEVKDEHGWLRTLIVGRVVRVRGDNVEVLCSSVVQGGLRLEHSGKKLEIVIEQVELSRDGDVARNTISTTVMLRN